MTDETGVTLTYGYDELGRQISVKDSLGSETKYTYDQAGNRTKVEDAEGNATSVIYDSRGRQVQVQDAEGRITKYSYDANNNVVFVTAPDGRNTRTTYNDSNQQIEVIHDSTGGPDGVFKVEYQYDNNGNIFQQRDYLGNEEGALFTTYAYDPLNQLYLTDQHGKTKTRTIRDSAGNLVLVRDPSGNQTQKFYDNLNRETREVSPLETTRITKYDEGGRLASTRDRNGREVVYEYDEYNRRSKEIWIVREVMVNRGLVEVSRVEKYEYKYDEAGRLTDVLDLTGESVNYHYTYDQLGRQETVTHSGGQGPTVELENSFDLVGNRTGFIGKINGSTDLIETATYNGIHQLESVKQDGPNTQFKSVTFAYDDAGRLETVSRSQTGMSGLTSSYEFTSNRLQSITHEGDSNLSVKHAYEYDDSGKIVKYSHTPVPSEPAIVKHYGYSKLGQLVYTGETPYDASKASSASYRYDQAGNPDFTDSQSVGNRLSAVEVQTGEKLVWNGSDGFREEDLETGHYEYEYDAEGNTVARWIPQSSVVIGNNHQGLNAESGTLDGWTDLPGFAHGTTLAVRDPAADRPEDSWSDNVAVAGASIDGLAVLTREEFAQRADAAELEVLDGDSQYAIWRTEFVQQEGEYRVLFDLPALLGQAEIAKLTERAEYTVRVRRDGELVESHTYEFSQRAALEKQIQAFISERYAVDAIIEDTEAWWDTALQYLDVPATSVDFANWLELLSDTDRDLFQQYYSSPLEELRTVLTWALDPETQTTIRDENAYPLQWFELGEEASSLKLESGDQVEVLLRSADNKMILADAIRLDSLAREDLTWDHRNRLQSATRYGIDGSVLSKVEYAYDGFDRRVRKTVTQASGNPSEHELEAVMVEEYVYDGSNIKYVFQDTYLQTPAVPATVDPETGEVVTAEQPAERVTEGTPLAEQTAPFSRHLFGQGVDQILAVEQQTPNGPTVFWQLTDHQSSVRTVAHYDSESQYLFQESFDYNEFGLLLNIEQSDRNLVHYQHRYAYTGREYDFETGLQYHRARYYDPAARRWISEDPIGFAGGDTNLYRYVGNSPLNYNDPSGNWAATTGGAVLGATAGFAYGLYQGEDWDKIIARTASGAMIGAGIGLMVDSLGAGAAIGNGLLTAGIGGLNTLGDGNSLDFSAWAAGTFVGGMSGMLSGGVAMGLGGMLGVGVGGMMTTGGAAGFISSAVNQLGHGYFDPYELVIATATGALSGGLARGMTGKIIGPSGRIASNQALRWHSMNTLAGAIGGALGDAVDQSYRIATDQQDGFQFGRFAQSTVSGAATGLASARGAWKAYHSCFAAGTELLTPDGPRRIELIKAGDSVLSRHEDFPDSPVEAKLVEETFEREGWIFELHVGGEQVDTTAEHPFFVLEKGWTATEDLETGDKLIGHDGEVSFVERIVKTDRFETVYNLHVSIFQTYFVTIFRQSVWAHNRYSDGEAAVRDIEGNIDQLELPPVVRERMKEALRLHDATPIDDVFYRYTTREGNIERRQLGRASDGSVYSTGYQQNQELINAGVQHRDPVAASRNAHSLLERHGIADNSETAYTYAHGHLGFTRATNHIEMQMIADGHNAIGTRNRNTCTSCLSKTKQVAMAENRDIVIADGSSTSMGWIFLADGTVKRFMVHARTHEIMLTDVEISVGPGTSIDPI